MSDNKRPTDRYTVLFLRAVGGFTLLAFFAAVMPERWMIDIAAYLGFEPFPYSPLTFYLARNLSLFYGFVGALLITLSFDIERYRKLIRLIGVAIVTFGVLQWVVDTMAGMPTWWILNEAPFTIAGGLILLWLNRRR